MLHRVPGLTQWLNRKRMGVSFTVPVVWNGPTNHVPDNYFRMSVPLRGSIQKLCMQNVSQV